MHCTNCGSELIEGVKFCTVCGAAAPVAGTEPKRRRPFPWKLTAILAAAVILVVGCVVGGILLFGGSGGSNGVIRRSAAALRILSMEDGTLLFASMDGASVECGKPRTAESYAASLEGLSGYMIDEDGALYVCTRTGKTRIAKDVVSAAISSDGKYVTYVRQKNDKATLHRCQLATEKDVELDGASSIPYLALSPDGKSVLYVVEDGGDSELFLSVGSKEPVSLGDDRYPIGLANGGKYVYYYEIDDDVHTLYAEHGGDAVKLGKGTGLEDGLIELNHACNELVYSLDDATYLSVNGAKGKKIVSDTAYVVLPDSTCWSRVRTTETMVYHNAVDTFTGRIYRAYANDGSYDEMLTYVSKKLEAEKLIDGVDGDVAISADARKLLYIKDGQLYYLSDTRKGGKAEKLFKKLTLRGVLATDDFGMLYLLTEDDTLYYATLDGTLEKLVSGVKNASLLSRTGKCFVMTDDKELYYCYKDSKREKVDVDGELIRISRYGDVPYYEVRSEANSSAFDQYRILDDLSSELIAKEMG